jgi:hypothetical protein
MAATMATVAGTVMAGFRHHAPSALADIVPPGCFSRSFVTQAPARAGTETPPIRAEAVDRRAVRLIGLDGSLVYTEQLVDL